MKNNQMKIYEDYITMLVRGHINSVLCHSKAGFGKTYTTIELLKKMNVDYIYTSGITTAVGLYKMLYNNKDKILILDDVETIFQDDRIVSLLKSALWEVDGHRIISYITTSKILVDYPDSFEYTGKLIILANEVRGRKDESFDALMSRCLKYELTYTLHELKEIANEIVMNDTSLDIDQKTHIISIVEETINPEHNFNFRLLQRLIAFVKYDKGKSKELFLNSLDVDEEVELILNIIKSNKRVSDQVAEYKECTGNSRMTFFRKKKKLKIEGFV